MVKVISHLLCSVFIRKIHYTVTADNVIMVKVITRLLLSVIISPIFYISVTAITKKSNWLLLSFSECNQIGLAQSNNIRWHFRNMILGNIIKQLILLNLKFKHIEKFQFTLLYSFICFLVLFC